MSYSEGWALYAESLGKELGVFTDPYQWYGRLSDEMLRAMRLVVDTGLHSKGWTREQAIQYMLDNSSLAESDVTAEVERYIVWPGQALGYKLGQLHISALRARAQAQLGASFDVREFHSQILRDGAVPMNVLTAKIDRWIASKQRPSNKNGVRPRFPVAKGVSPRRGLTPFAQEWGLTPFFSVVAVTQRLDVDDDAVFETELAHELVRPEVVHPDLDGYFDGVLADVYGAAIAPDDGPAEHAARSSDVGGLAALVGDFGARGALGHELGAATKSVGKRGRGGQQSDSDHGKCPFHGANDRRILLNGQ